MKRKIYIFDLDKTITSCDTFVYFFFFIIIYEPFSFIKKFLHLLYNGLLFKLTKKIEYKSNFLFYLLRNLKKKKLNNIVNNFCNFIVNYKLNKTILSILQKKNIKNNFIIISASPDIYVKRLAKILKAKKFFATKISLNKKNFGKIIGKNCFGEQKKEILQHNIKNFKNLNTFFYTDSYDDISLLKFCRKSFLVSNKKIIKFK